MHLLCSTCIGKMVMLFIICIMIVLRGQGPVVPSAVQILYKDTGKVLKSLNLRLLVAHWFLKDPEHCCDSPLTNRKSDTFVTGE